MNTPLFTQDNLLFTVTTPLGENQLLFKSLQGEEFLSELFHFHLEMFSERQDVDFHKIVGKVLTVNIRFAPEQTRYLNGIVTRFSQAGSDARFTTYHAEIRPWLWLLTLTKNSQIFQNLSVPEIIKQVFAQSGFTDYQMKLVYSYEKRIYCVQYEETAFNFVSRLMEDEGMFYFFEHTETQHILILADDLGVHQACPGISTARFWTQNTQELTQPEDVVTALESVGQVRTIAYAVDDFNFETPRNDLQTGASAAENSILKKTIFKTDDAPRIYDYPAGFEQISQGERTVRLRLEACTADARLVEGQGHCFSFIPGYHFTLTRHPRSDLNSRYVLRWVSHTLSLTNYHNRFRAAPADFPFRAPRVTPRPRIVGTQTAIVTGPANEEIWTDKYGRIKVQFHWDQQGQYDENSSCWIRVNQGWAGKGWGHLAIPRIGQEVIVSFLEGDPDRPLVTGAVYNALQRVPYPLPAEQTKSTLKSHSSKGGQGFNEVRFEDKKGEEQIFIHAQKDEEIVVENTAREWIGNERHLVVKTRQLEQVEADKHLTVQGHRFQLLKGDTHLTVEGDQLEWVKQNQHLIVGGEQMTAVKGNEHLIVQGNHNERSCQKRSIRAKTDFHAEAGMTLSLKAGMQLTIQAGESFITLDASGITIQGAMVKVNSGGTPGECSPVPPAKPDSPSAPELPSGGPPATSAKEASPGQLLTAKTLKQAAQEGTPFCEQCMQCNN